MPGALLALRDVSLGYEGRPVLQHLTLAIERGEFLALLGPNGAGKTTLLRGLVGLIPVLAGELTYGLDRRASPPGYVPQRDTLDPIFPLSALEVVLMGTYARLPPLRPVGRRERRLGAECLAQVGLAALAPHPFWSLSGGQKQRVLIARALAAEPELLLLHAPQPRAPPDRRARDAPAPARPAGRPERHLGRRGQRHQGPDGGDAGPGADRRRLRRAGGRRMSALAEILSPDFLLRDALFGSILVGLVCPLVGAYFVLRRMIFLGVALPQLSAAGIASAFVAFQFLVGPHEHGQVSERALAMAGSFAFTLGGLLVLAAFERQGKETIEARIGVAYAVAAALTILFLAADPHGDAQMVNLLKGDILATTSTSLAVLIGVFGAVTAVLFAFRKEFLLVSFDRDLAVVFGKRVGLWDGLLYLLIGVTISLGVMTAGPLVTFGFLVVPPLTARLVTRRMLSFSLVAAVLGGASAFGGFYLAYRIDLPLGPAEVALASLFLALVGAGTALRRAAGRLPS